MRREPARVTRLQANSSHFQTRAKAAGLDVGTSWGVGIIPVMIGDTVRTLKLSERLLARGINAFPILPPGVPERTARLRFFINQTHEPNQLDDAVTATLEELTQIRDLSLNGVLQG